MRKHKRFIKGPAAQSKRSLRYECIPDVISNAPIRSSRILLILIFSIRAAKICPSSCRNAARNINVVCKILPENSVYGGFGDSVRRALSAVSRFAAYHVPGTSFRVTNAWGTDLSRPAVLVSNHLSVLDLVCILSLSPHIVVVAKDWAWRSPFFGYIIRQAGFLPVADGIE